jgi:hypothetical protein
MRVFKGITFAAPPHDSLIGLTQTQKLVDELPG